MQILANTNIDNPAKQRGQTVQHVLGRSRACLKLIHIQSISSRLIKKEMRGMF